MAPDAQLALLQDLADQFTLTNLQPRLRAARQLADTPASLQVAVLGQFKAGKSSLLNTLIGTALLPVQAIPATAVVTSVRYAPSATATVVFNDGHRLQIELRHLADYVVEQRNPDNAKGVARVDLTAPGLARLPDLVLTDTPGLGSSHDLNTATSLDWLPNAGAALVAISATQPLAAADLDLVVDLAPHTPHIAVVVTKADLLSEPDLNQVLAFIDAQLRRRTTQRLPLIAFSSLPTRPDLQHDLTHYLADHLQTSHRSLTSSLLAHRLHALQADTRTYLTLALTAAEATDRARHQLLSELAAERHRLPQLGLDARTIAQRQQTQLRQTALDTVSGHIDPLTRRIHHQLDAELPTWRGSLAQQTRRYRDWLAASLQNETTELANELSGTLTVELEHAREPLDRIGQAFSARLATHVRNALGLELQPPAPATVTPPPQTPQPALGRVFDSQLELLSWAIPIRLVQPALHRHFRSMVPWEVEKNLIRLANQTAGGFIRATDRLVRDYLAAIEDELATYERLARPETGRGAEAVQHALELLGAPPIETLPPVITRTPEDARAQ